MKINEILSGNTKAVAAAPGLIILLLLACGIVCSAFSAGPRPFLEIPDGKTCVKDAAYMRSHHMDLLKEARDEVVREGKEGRVEFDGRQLEEGEVVSDGRHDPRGCRHCHKSRERFCNRCHDKVNLNPDCFRCHHYPN